MRRNPGIKLNVANRARAVVMHDRAEREVVKAQEAFNAHTHLPIAIVIKFEKALDLALRRLHITKALMARHGCLGC